MKKDKRTKAQLLEEISRLQAHVKQLTNRCDEIKASYETDDCCRLSTRREYKLSEELSATKDDRKIFKQTLKYIFLKERI